MELSAKKESWRLQEAFTISRGSKTEAEVVVVTVSDGGYRGCGECVPYKRYGETPQSVLSELSTVSTLIKNGLKRTELKGVLSPGAARNALDCAMWDLEAKQQNQTIWQLLDLNIPIPKLTSYTISLDTPEKMAEKASAAAQQYSLLKIKLGGENDEECLRKIRESAPGTRLIVDANEGWSSGNLSSMLKVCELAGVELVEQPLPADNDEELTHISSPVLICADESFHTAEDFPKVANKYSAINIKLDKTGGLTEALEIIKRAQKLRLPVMVGCMVSTSLSIAPATVIAQYAQYVDLDGPLLLTADRENAVGYKDGSVYPTNPLVWG
jgi:L-alanine-DL-glutamate epimerase-like enolase superfamily enzyme